MRPKALTAGLVCTLRTILRLAAETVFSAYLIKKGKFIHMKEKLATLRALFEEQSAAVTDKAQLEQLRIGFMGKNGTVTALFKELRELSGEDKRDAATGINILKKDIEEFIAAKSAELEAAEQAALISGAERYDLTLPSSPVNGSLHPITLVQSELEDIFASMGFTIEDFREIVDDYDNFEAVNIPPHHPARDMQDTYFLDNGQLLKTHTSAAQNSIMRKYGAPLRAIFPGRCFRNEAIDASHENTFFQMEGMMIDENISISNLIYFMKTMLSEVFQREINVRLRPGFFPFVEPGFELDISCHVCGGTGCPTCKHGGWIELCPCGMIHPNVLAAGGIDSEKYTGFAFGLGLTRLAMMKYGVKDIRMLNSGNLKSLSQFTEKK